MIKGIGGLEFDRGDHGGGRPWRRKRVMPTVVITNGMVAASISLRSKYNLHVGFGEYKKYRKAIESIK